MQVLVESNMKKDKHANSTNSLITSRIPFILDEYYLK
jgi:hypothetical protein